MNIRKKILTRCGALLTAVLVLAPTALAAEAEIPYTPRLSRRPSLLRQTRGGRRTGSCCW